MCYFFDPNEQQKIHPQKAGDNIKSRSSPNVNQKTHNHYIFSCNVIVKIIFPRKEMSGNFS